MLAEEFDEKGINPSKDKYGFKNITGLNLKNKAIAPSRSKLDSNRSELRGFRRIDVAGGVSLFQPKDVKKAHLTDNDYVKISGGAYEPSQNKMTESQSSTGNLHASRMTMDAYAELSGTRKYTNVAARQKLAKKSKAHERNSASSILSGNSSKAMQDNHLRVINMNTVNAVKQNDEPDLISLQRKKIKKIQMRPFASNKNFMGRVLVNDTIDSNQKLESIMIDKDRARELDLLSTRTSVERPQCVTQQLLKR